MSTDAPSSRLGAVAALILTAGWATVPGCIVVVGDESMCTVSEPQFERKATASVQHEPSKPFRVESPSGGVTVRKGGTDSVSVEATLRGPDENRLKEGTIVAERQSDGTLLVTVKWPGDRRPNESASLDITIPDTGSIEVKSAYGAIRVEDLGGKASLESGSGSIQVSNHAGPVNARTDYGAIKVIGCEGSLGAKSGSGSISVERAGGAVEAATDYGSVKVTGCAGALSARSGSGSISAEDIKGDVKSVTSYGSIQVKACERDVDAKSGSGAISVDAAKGSVHAATDYGRITVHGCDGTVSAGSGSGGITIEDGKGAVDAHTDYGSITLSLAALSRGPVKANTDSGRINLALSPDFQGTVEARTERGSVDVRDVVGARVEKSGRQSATLTFGDGAGPASSIRSGNGGIIIRSAR